MITEGFGYTLSMSWSNQVYIQKCLDVGCHTLGDDLGYFGEIGYRVLVDEVPELIKLNTDGLGIGLVYLGKNDDTNEIALLYKDITGKYYLIRPKNITQET